MQNYIYFILLSFLWGGSFVAIKFVVDVIPPVAGAMIRVGIGLVFLGLLFGLRGKSLSLPQGLRVKVWLTGLISIGLPFAFLFWGERSITPGLAGIINGSVPIWTFFLGILFLPHLEAFSGRKFAGLVLGLAGVVAIFWPALKMPHANLQFWGMAAVFCMALSYSVSSLMNRYFLAGNKNLTLAANTFHQHLASFVFLILASLMLEDWSRLGMLFQAKAALLSIIYLGIFSTALALLMFYHLIREWGAFRATAVTYVIPLIGLALDFFFFQNVPTPNEIIGLIIVLSGVVLLQYPERGRAKLKPETLPQPGLKAESLPKISPNPQLPPREPAPPAPRG